jgi:ApbE superfamily uncharacterized protein (UPF0280 family)
LYQARLYREGMNSDRFRFFPSIYQESDLLIGVPRPDYLPEMPGTSLQEQIRLYRLLTSFSVSHPSFRTSLEPLPVPAGEEEVPPEVATMFRCGLRTGTGPMSSVAGLFAEVVAERLTERFTPTELVVENGGDLFIRNRSDLVTVIHAGRSSLSGKIGLVLPPGSWGVCTSSGTVGHSFSMGKADAVTVVSKSTPMADAWATALANQVKGQHDIEPVLDRVSGIREIKACLVIVGEKMGVRGKFELKLLS